MIRSSARSLVMAAVCCACLASPFAWSDDGKSAQKQDAETKKSDTALKATTKARAKTKADQAKAEPPKSDKPKTPAQAADIDVIAGPIVEALGEKLQIKAAAAVVIDGAMAVNNNEAMIQQWQQNFQQQLQPILNAELAVIRQFCDLPRDQRPKIKAAGEAALKDVARKMAQQQQQPGIAGRGNQTVNPRTEIRAALANALKPVLAEADLNRYLEEVASRVADRKLAATLVIVSRLDNLLFLTKQQREQIAESIASNWQEKWEQWLMYQGYPENYVPQMNDQLVSKYLTAAQKSVWSTMQKVEFGFFEPGPVFGVANDGWWGDAPNAAQGGLFLNNIFIDERD